jgi:hypothetical protein
MDRLDMRCSTRLDASEHLDYFVGIEKVLSSIGLSISDAVMTFLNAGGVQNKEVGSMNAIIDGRNVSSP